MSRPVIVLVALYLGAALALLLLSLNAQAAVSLTGTRLIFDGRFREASIDAINHGEREVLIQSWLSSPDNSDGSPQSAGDDLPFVLTPHLVQLNPRGRQTLRVLYQGVGMPLDRESLLHLYVLEVPRRKESSHSLSIAIRQRINLFYRPTGLTGDPGQAPETLRWALASGGAGLKVSNPGVFHVSLLDMRLDDVLLRNDLLLAPGESRELPLPARTAGQRLSFVALTDYGGQRGYCAQVDRQSAFSARLLSAPSCKNNDSRQKDC